MSGEPVDGLVLGERPNPDRAIRTSGDEHIAAHLELADQGSVALENGQAPSIAWVPDSDAGVQATRHHSPTIEGDSVDLAEVSIKDSDAFAFADAPDSRRGVVTSGDDQVPANFHTADGCLMSHEHMLADAFLDVPYAQSGVAGSGDGSGRVGHLETAHGRRVAAKSVHRRSVFVEVSAIYTF